jgi:heme-degrading monooxygenase HmoA
MYTRIVSFNVQPQNREKVEQIFSEQIAPALRKVSGFVDFCVLEDIEDRNRLQSLTFWKTPQDADRYHNNEYPKLRGLIDPYMTKPGELRKYHVQLSTSQGIAKAA